MHPEIEQDYPGDCPKCGMPLEPKTMAAEKEENGEIRSLSRRFWVALILTLPVLFIASIYNALGVPIAAGLLYPFFGLLLSPMIAGAAMSVSSLCVVGNALRLRGVPP